MTYTYKDTGGMYNPALEIKRPVTLWRFYLRGTRITIDAKSKREALERLASIEADFKPQLARVNRTTPRRLSSPRHNYRRAIELRDLNAWDQGYDLGAQGLNILSALIISLDTHSEQQAARYGFVEGYSFRKGY